MAFVRFIKAVLAISVGLGIVMLPAAANAAPPVAGSWTQYFGPQLSSTYRSYGSATWTSSTQTVELRALGYGLAAGYCETMYFDWRTNPGIGESGHHDSRAARDCTSGGGTAYRTWNDTWNRINGAQKLGVCYGLQNTTGSCSVYPGTDISTIPKNFTTLTGVYCISWQVVYPDGATQYNGGGDSRQCES